MPAAGIWSTRSYFSLVVRGHFYFLNGKEVGNYVIFNQ